MSALDLLELAAGFSFWSRPAGTLCQAVPRRFHPCCYALSSQGDLSEEMVPRAVPVRGGLLAGQPAADAGAGILGDTAAQVVVRAAQLPLRCEPAAPETLCCDRRFAPMPPGFQAMSGGTSWRASVHPAAQATCRVGAGAPVVAVVARRIGRVSCWVWAGASWIVAARLRMDQ